MTEVSDIGPTLQTPVELQAARNYFYQKDHIPAIWHQYLKTGKYPPFLFQQTSFINLFSADKIILFDLYRPPWKPYYTSDVFFYQWLKSMGSDINLYNLPLQFPGTIYVHNVTNQVSKHMLKEILNETTSDAYLIDQLMDARWSKLRTTPHLKTVMRILDTYNNLNSLRGRSAYYISGLKIYKRAELYHLKFNFTVAAGMPD